MSDIVKEKTIMDEVREKYIRFVSDSLMMSEKTALFKRQRITSKRAKGIIKRRGTKRRYKEK